MAPLLPRIWAQRGLILDLWMAVFLPPESRDKLLPFSELYFTVQKVRIRIQRFGMSKDKDIEWRAMTPVP